MTAAQVAAQLAVEAATIQKSRCELLSNPSFTACTDLWSDPSRYLIGCVFVAKRTKNLSISSGKQT